MVTLLLEAPAKNGEAIVSTWSLLKCTVLGLLHRRIVESEINININRMITAISMHFSNEAFASSLSSRVKCPCLQPVPLWFNNVGISSTLSKQ